MTIYISGKITDNPNAEAQFKAAEQQLKLAGYKVVNPMKLNQHRLSLIIKSDAIYQLPTWRGCSMCKLEYRIAKELEMTIMSERRGK